MPGKCGTLGIMEGACHVQMTSVDVLADRMDGVREAVMVN